MVAVLYFGRVSNCGGSTRNRCNFYGTKDPPSEAELDHKTRHETWSDGALKKNCAYNPYCTKKACGTAVVRKGITAIFFMACILLAIDCHQQRRN